MSKITITISRTVQVQQYEPLTITLTEEVESKLTGTELDKFKLRKTQSLGKVLARAMERELDRYRV